MKPSSGQRGTLYVLTNERVLRFDLETKESLDLFPNLPWAPAARYHLTYLKHLGELGFFDYDYDIETDKWKSDFLLGDPRTGEVKVLFDSGREIGLGALSYSPNEEWVAFLASPPGPENEPENVGEQVRPLPPHRLIIRRLFSKDEILVTTDGSPPAPPPLWLSDQTLLYVNYSQELVQIDIETKKKEPWGIFHILPWALSPDGKSILCTDKDYSSIYLLDVATKSLKLVRKYGGYRMVYGNMLWSPDGRSFIFNRRVLRDHLLPQYLLGETPWRLYWRDLETGKEERLSKDPWWKDPWKEPWLYGGAVWFLEDPFQ